MVVTSKKWTKKKFGYGWVTSKKTEYTCLLGQLSQESPILNPTDDNLSTSPVQGTQRGSEVLVYPDFIGSEVDQNIEVLSQCCPIICCSRTTVLLLKRRFFK